MQMYYVGKRRAQEIRADQLDNWSLPNQADSEFECSDVAGDEENSTVECINDEQGNSFAADIPKHSSELEPKSLQNIIEYFVDDVNSPKILRTIHIILYWSRRKTFLHY